MKKTIILIFFFFVNLTFSQHEKVIVNLNSQTFVTGEKLLYNVFLLNKTNNQKNTSKIVYVELYDKKNNPLFKHKIFIKNNTGEGYFFIDTNIKTGNYALVSYTNSILNDSKPNIFTKNITIINPYKETSSDIKIDIPLKIILDSTKNTSNLKKREKIELKNIIKEFPEADQYSVSVKLKNSITFKNEIPVLITKYDSIINFKIFDEIEGNVVTGIVESNSKPVNNLTVGINCDCDSPYLETVQTDKNGNFKFVFQKPIPTNRIKIFLVDTDNSSYSIKLNNFKFQNNYKINIEDSIFLQKKYIEEIDKIILATQIENAYNSVKKDSILKKTNFNLINSKLFKVYNLSDYTRFSSLKETIIEIINEMHYTDKNNDFKIHLRNYNDNLNMEEAPLIFVNDKIILNQNDLLVLDIKKINTIKFINQQYYFGNKIYGGIIEIISEENLNFHNDKFIYKEIINYLPNIKLYSPKYPNEKLKRIPDYRNQLFWKTGIKKSNLENLSFYTSDLEGEFEVCIFGLTKNGNYFSTAKSFFVK